MRIFGPVSFRRGKKKKKIPKPLLLCVILHQNTSAILLNHFVSLEKLGDKVKLAKFTNDLTVAGALVSIHLCVCFCQNNWFSYFYPLIGVDSWH